MTFVRADDIMYKLSRTTDKQIDWTANNIHIIESMLCKLSIMMN